MNSTIEQKIKTLPLKPGVYIMKDNQGTVIYVGKAKKLKNRVSQYFFNTEKLPKVQHMVDHICDFDFFVVNSEYDALALENTLIKKYQPFYNILLKDNKNFQYIRLNKRAPFPKFDLTRKMNNKDIFFGPYFAGISAKDILETINYAYPLVKCNLHITPTSKPIRPCIFYDMHLCSAPCAKKISQDNYNQIVNDAVKFLHGDTEKIENILREKMAIASESENYETAIKLRDSLKMLSRLKEKVVTQLPTIVNYDIFDIYSNGEQTALCVMVVRGGRMIGVNSFTVKDYSLTKGDFLAEFLSQYYQINAYTCDTVILSCEIDDTILCEMVQKKYNKHFKYEFAQKGVKKTLLNMCVENSKLHLEKNISIEKKEYDQSTGALEILKRELNLDRVPNRIECYDISNTFGTSTVSSMSVLIGGKKAPKHYRKFKINSVDFIDDFESMRETLRRRFSEFDSEDISFSSKPDLIVIDGGKGQLSAALEVKKEFGYDGEIISLAKRLEEVFTPKSERSILLPHGSYALRVLQLARDEAHRTAITFNRLLRDKSEYKGGLVGIKGVGPTTRRILLDKYKTLQNIKQASLTDLESTKGISKTVAKNVYDSFNSPDNVEK